jgi:5-methylthioadenosine/S-adenosylhomocysteine deaminase
MDRPRRGRDMGETSISPRAVGVAHAAGGQVAQPRTLIRNAALILTMDPTQGTGDLGVIEGADLLLVGDKIAAVGKPLREDGSQIIDATSKIVMPGFVDVHNHLWQSLIRGCQADQDLIGWLETCVFPLANPAITPSEMEAYAGCRLSTLDLITTGVTTVVDWSHSFSPAFARGNIRALDESGLRFAFAYHGYANPAVVDDIKRVKKDLIDPHPRATLQVASHPGTSSRLLPHLQAMSTLAKELGVTLHVHLLENIAQRQDEAVKALILADALGPDLLGAHAIHLLDEEISLLAQKDVRLAHNPLSNMRLASGIIRLPALHQAGVKLGLGLDGGTNDTSDMFNTMRVAMGLQRATSLQASVFPTVSEVLRMATLGGAEVLDMDGRIGSLTPGKQADVLILDPGGTNFAPRLNWIAQIVLNGQPANVDWVFVDGQPRKAHGRLVGVDPAPIVQAAEEAARRIGQDLHLA